MQVFRFRRERTQCRVSSCGRQGAQGGRGGAGRSGATSRTPRPEPLWRERRCAPAAPPAPHGRRAGPRHSWGPGGPESRPRTPFPLLLGPLEAKGSHCRFACWSLGWLGLAPSPRESASLPAVPRTQPLTPYPEGRQLPTVIASEE